LGWKLSFRQVLRSVLPTYVFDEGHPLNVAPQNTLPQILCGLPTGAGESDAALIQLTSSISKFANKATVYANEADVDNLLTFGPFCGRVILENGCAALMGRLDPFRLMYLSEFQRQPEYELGKRVKSAFSWAGDVIADEKSDASLWHTDRDMDKISRSLFSRHCDHLYWKPAVSGLLDFIAGRTDEELTDILQIAPENFIAQTRGRFTQYYSQLSKGVHWEFFNSAQQLDEITVRTLLRDTAVHLAALGLASHFIPTAYSSLLPDDAVGAYIEFRRAVP
jgi:hypothetical protein